MLVRTVPLDGGTFTPDSLGDAVTRRDSDEDTIAGLGALLDAAPGAGLDLPCGSGNSDLWFADTPADLERAKALCGPCPVKAECLAGALRRGEPWGVWGGEIFERGTVIPRKRPRGRPSKADLARDREYAAALSA